VQQRKFQLKGLSKEFVMNYTWLAFSALGLNI